ncbi:MAG TPA: hypothetical protein VE549_14495, partial [Myxococcaceae bacterium]|nr:hypothetical protein [Myxococcaceae bacterium]
SVRIAAARSGFLAVITQFRTISAMPFQAGRGLPAVHLGSSSSSDVSVASDGEGFAVAWQDVDRIAHARFFSAGQWSPTVALGASAERTFKPAIASAGEGYLLAWRRVDDWPSNASELRLARWLAGTLWLAPLTPFAESTVPLGDPLLSANASGWTILYARGSELRTAFAPATSAGAMVQFGAPVTLATEATHPSLAAGPSAFAAVWVGASAAGGTSAFAASAAAGAWTPVSEVTALSGIAVGTQLARSEAGFTFVAATSINGVPALKVSSFVDGTWQPAIDPALGGTSPAEPQLAPAPDGTRLSITQDDGVAHRVHLVAEQGGRLSPPVNLLATVLPSSASGARVSGDDAGRALVVWSQPHRGAPAVFAALATEGVFGEPFLVGLRADFAVVASNGKGFLIAYRGFPSSELPRSVIVRGFDGASLGPPEVLGPIDYYEEMALTSDGAGYAVAWPHSGEGVWAAIESDGEWSPVAPVGPFADFAYPPVLAGGPHGYVMAYEPVIGDMIQLARARRYGDGTWSWTASEVFGGIFGPDHGPSVASGAGGFAVVWSDHAQVWAIIDTGDGFGAPVLVRSQIGCFWVDVLPIGTGFEVLFRCGTSHAQRFDAGWAAPREVGLNVLGAVTAIRPGGWGLLGAIGGGALSRVEALGDQLTKPRAVVAGGAAGAAIGWDGQAYIGAWTEVDPGDPMVRRIVAQRGP